MSYKFVLTSPTDTDPPVASTRTIDNVSGVNDTTVTSDQWVAGPTPTFVSTTSFTLVGDQTSTFHVGRRVKTTNSGGTIYSRITVSAFTALTTITVVNDSGVLDSGLSAVSYGLLSATNPSIPVTANSFPLVSFAPNPFFEVDQLANSATSVSDDNYGHDHWYVLTQTASVQVSTGALQENGQTTNARLTQNQAAAQRMGYACIIEASEAKKLRGQVMTFQPRIRCSSAQAIRIGVVEWTGTADSVTSDIVNDWTSSDYTDGAGRFFVDANQAPLGTSTITPGAATWADATSLPVTVGSSCNNLILFVWTEGTAAQNVTLDIGKVRFVQGLYNGDIYIPRFDETLRYAMRFFQKSFPYGTAPVQGVNNFEGSAQWPSTVAGAVAGISPTFLLPVWLRAVPTSNATYNPSSAVNAQARNVTDSADMSSTGIVAATNWVQLSATGNAGLAVGETVAVHWTISSRL